jgi:hypothetical protein
LQLSGSTDATKGRKLHRGGGSPATGAGERAARPHEPTSGERDDGVGRGVDGVGGPTRWRRSGGRVVRQIPAGGPPMGHGEHRQAGPQEQRVSNSQVGPEVGTCGRVW